MPSCGPVRGPLRAVALGVRHLALSVEVPTLALARTVSTVQRARRALDATKAVLAQLDADRV